MDTLPYVSLTPAKNLHLTILLAGILAELNLSLQFCFLQIPYVFSKLNTKPT